MHIPRHVRTYVRNQQQMDFGSCKGVLEEVRKGLQDTVYQPHRRLTPVFWRRKNNTIS